MNIIQNLKEWIRGLGLSEDEIILDKETYQALQEKYDKTASELTDTKTQLKLTESERDYVNKRLTGVMQKYEQLINKYDEVKDYNAQVKFEFKPESQNKGKRKAWKIIKGDSIFTTGVIKKSSKQELYKVQVKDSKRTYEYTTSYKDKAVLLYNEFNKRKLKPEEFNKLKTELFPLRTGKPTYIYKRNDGKYTVNKSIQGKTTYFGVFNSKEQAEEIRDFLVWTDWDTQYLPTNVCNVSRNTLVNMEEYLMKMRMFIKMNKEYQQYLGNTVNFTFYDK